MIRKMLGIERTRKKSTRTKQCTVFKNRKNGSESNEKDLEKTENAVQRNDLTKFQLNFS